MSERKAILINFYKPRNNPFLLFLGHGIMLSGTQDLHKEADFILGHYPFDILK